MGNVPTWYLVLQTIVSFAITSTLIVYAAQLFVMRRQLRATYKVSQAQALLDVIKLLQEQSVREARDILFSLRSKPLKSWTQSERMSAERAIRIYDMAGILVREGLVPLDAVMDLAIDPRTYEVAPVRGRSRFPRPQAVSERVHNSV